MQCLHVEQRLGLCREAGVGLAVGLAGRPALARFAGLEELTRDILDCCHGDFSPSTLEHDDRRSMKGMQGVADLLLRSHRRQHRVALRLRASYRKIALDLCGWCSRWDRR